MGFAKEWGECGGNDGEDSKWEGFGGGEFSFLPNFCLDWFFVGMVEEFGMTSLQERKGLERDSANLVVL